jgi:hypothetical protein
MKSVEMVISPDGSEMEVKVDGVKGESCTEVTKGITDAIFGRTISSEKTSEYFQQEVDVVHNNT